MGLLLAKGLALGSEQNYRTRRRDAENRLYGFEERFWFKHHAWAASVGIVVRGVVTVVGVVPEVVKSEVQESPIHRSADDAVSQRAREHLWE